MFVVHLHVDVRDAMGANAVNTMAELIAPRIETLTGGRVLLRILSNLATERMARIEARLPRGHVDDGDAAQGARSSLASSKPTTSPPPTRTGRHAQQGRHERHQRRGHRLRPGLAGHRGRLPRLGGRPNRPLRLHDRVGGRRPGYLVGRLETPMAVGTVGGASRVHPTARACLEILGIDAADRLAAIMTASGWPKTSGIACVVHQRHPSRPHAPSCSEHGGQRGRRRC